MPLTTTSHPTSPQRRFDRWVGALRDFVIGLLFFVLVTAANAYLVEPSIPGQLLRRMTYDWLQLRLAVSRENEHTEVAVVDIGSLPTCPKDLQFPRKALMQAVDAVVKERPAAIGIDIDFSPGPNVSCEISDDASPYDLENVDPSKWDWTPRGGPVFFQYCLKQPVPIFLGVFRTQDRSREEWLGGDEFASLATALLVPPEEGMHEDEARRLAERIGQRRYMPRAFRTERDRLPSMSEALFQRRREKTPSARQWLASWLPATLKSALFETQRTEHPNDSAFVDEYLVDFSARHEMRDRTSIFKNGTLFIPKSQTLKDTLVLLGHTDVRTLRDKFPLPGSGELEAGVYWHAAGADTLVRGVLAKPTNAGRWALDAGFYVPILVFILVLRLLSSREVNASRLESFLTKIFAVIVVIFGLLLINLTRLMWDDFVIISILVALHPTIERWAHAALHGLGASLRIIWARVTA